MSNVNIKTTDLDFIDDTFRSITQWQLLQVWDIPIHQPFISFSQLFKPPQAEPITTSFLADHGERKTDEIRYSSQYMRCKNASLVLSICSFRSEEYYSSDPFGTGFRRLYAHAQLKETELHSSYLQPSLTQPNTSIQMIRQYLVDIFNSPGREVQIISVI